MRSKEKKAQQRAERERLREIEREETAKCRERIIEAIGDAGLPEWMDEPIFDLAWDRGHSHGYECVEAEADEMIYKFSQALKKEQQ